MSRDSGRLPGLYLHVPFCTRVCPYCDFAVRTGNPERRRHFVDCLIAEIELWASEAFVFDTVYFGGGTPSLLDSEDLGRIVEAARRHLSIADDCRIFLEANPENVDRAALEDWLALGVAYLSLGIQSFDAASLSYLGRRHDPIQARAAVELALGAGFETVSIDLIYGLPDQQSTGWRREMQLAVELGVDHLSCYQLTIHQGTRFGLLQKRGELTELGHEGQAELFRLTHEFLADAGLPGYEVSQFAAHERHRSRHNQKYWDHTPYLGLGPSAHSYRDRRRWWNLRRTDPYQDRVRTGERPIESTEILDPHALALESLMTGFRTLAGVDLEAIGSRWGVELSERNSSLVERLTSAGYLRPDRGRLAPTLEGLAIADSLAARFELC